MGRVDRGGGWARGLPRAALDRVFSMLGAATEAAGVCPCNARAAFFSTTSGCAADTACFGPGPAPPLTCLSMASTPQPPLSPPTASIQSARGWSTESLALLASLFFVLVSNRAFWSSAVAGRSATDPATWLFCACVFTLLVALHFVALLLISLRRTVKPLLMVLLVATAVATYFMHKYSVFLDPTMLRNLVHTDPGEARDLLAWDMLPHLALQAALPAWLVWRCVVLPRRFAAAVGWRVGAIVAALLVGAAAFLAVSQDLSSLMRSQKAMRYLVTPANYVYSLARVATADAVTAAKPLVPIGVDAVTAPAAVLRSKPPYWC